MLFYFYYYLLTIKQVFFTYLERRVPSQNESYEVFICLYDFKVSFII